MKVVDIKTKPITIVSGIFRTETFRFVRKYLNVRGYGEFIKWSDAPTVIAVVRDACSRADMIIFVLDEVYFPINKERSHTCEELELVCSIDGFFNKTIFVKGDNVIDFDKNLVITT